MENISADIIRKTALELSPRDVLSLCLSRKSFSKMICDSDVFWRNKIKIDYPRQTYSLEIYQKTPKKLYMLLTMNSKIIELNFPGLKEALEEYDLNDIDNIEIIAKIINDYIKPEFIFANNIKRGDVLHLAWGSYYRNDDKFLWDGEKVVVLDYNKDEYGSVPKELAFPEFRPEYFSESIGHNNIVRLSPEKVQEVENNFDIDTQTSYVTDKYNKYVVKLNCDILDADIKFNKIFLEDYLEYEDVFFLNMKVISSYGSNSKSETVFFPEWKNAIISITPHPEYTYEWEEDTLIVEKIKDKKEKKERGPIRRVRRI